jgi:hypothetical protein
MFLIETKNLIETILGVKRSVTGIVTDYGLMGRYTYQGGFQNVAFSIGNPPRTVQVESVSGLEAILLYPNTRKVYPLATQKVYSEKLYRLSLIEHSDRQGFNAVTLLERSARLQCFNYIYIPADPEIGNYPQWNLTFKGHEFRDKVESYNYV